MQNVTESSIFDNCWNCLYLSLPISNYFENGGGCEGVVNSTGGAKFDHPTPKQPKMSQIHRNQSDLVKNILIYCYYKQTSLNQNFNLLND